MGRILAKRPAPPRQAVLPSTSKFGAVVGVPASRSDILSAALQDEGQPLDIPTRLSFERQFGHSFADVRVHTGMRAATAAEVLGARAFTFGSQICFASGEYSLTTLNGRHLLAHELAHVCQQRETGRVDRGGIPGQAGTIESDADHAADLALKGRGTGALQKTGPAILCQRGGPSSAETRRDERLRDLASNPYFALRAWSGLSPAAQSILLAHMTRKYGSSFANAFLSAASDPHLRRRRPILRTTYIPLVNPARLYAAGWRFAGYLEDVMVWVLPTGEVMHVLPPGQPAAGKTAPSASTGTQPGETSPAAAPAATELGQPAPRLPPRSTWGPEMERRDRFTIGSLTGRAILYEDGTVTFEAAGGQLLTYRPHPGPATDFNQYDVYDADGNLIENVFWTFDLDEVFGKPGSIATPSP